MKKDALILGIETSCDETSCALVLGGKKILSNVISSQIPIHKRYGGVVPELASRAHLKNLPYITDKALSAAKKSYSDLDCIAVTYGPGLVGALLIGVSFAKGLGFSLGIPVIGINHIQAHIYANFLENPDISFPFVSMVVSGGHTSLFYLKSFDDLKLLGQTKDDACGEAFDKIAKILGLGFPGGPVIDRISRNGDPEAIDFPRAYMGKDNLDFSFSGLKTAVFRFFSDKKKREQYSIEDIAASFQTSIVDVLVDKCLYAAKKKKVKSVLLAGGVGRNSLLRSRLFDEGRKLGMNIYAPSPILCTDNAAMIAGLGYLKFKNMKKEDILLDGEPNLRLGG